MMAYACDTWTGAKADLDHWRDAPLGELIHHIVEKYHREARVEMARLETQAAEAALLESAAHPELRVILDEVDRFCGELRAHFKQEERTVFPALLAVRDGGGTPAALRDPLRLLQEEHAFAAGLMQRIHQLTEGFLPAQGAGAVQRKLFATFQLLAESLSQHIYLENQVLFKRVLHNQA
jgi:regulator of cell morphogenesis and NO signaling